MAEVGSQEWIEQSLVRLDELERERDGHETALEQSNDAESLKEHSEAIERLDAEIKELYELLETVAEGSGEEEEEQELPTNPYAPDEPAAAAAPVPGPAEVAAAPAAAAAAPLAPAADDNPFGSPAPAPADDSPFGGAPAAPAGGFGDGAVAMDSYDDFNEPKGGAGKWIAIAAVVLLAAGGGGYYYMTQMAGPAEAPKQEAPKEKIVIEAKEVPDDTQGPKGAKGQDVDKTPTSDELDGDKKKSGGGGGGGAKKKPPKKKKGIDLSGAGDPLG